MLKDKNSLLLYAVTDRSWLKNQTLAQQVELALMGGATMIQIREKTLGDGDFLSEATEIKKICEKFNCPLIINDNVDIAIKIKADGVHIGQHDMDCKTARGLLGGDFILGVSAQTVEQAVKAEMDGADYLGVGAVFSTSTKKDANNITLETLAEINKAVKIPTVAIGGIGKSNILELAGSGISGVAVVSAIFAQGDIVKATNELLFLAKKIAEV